MCRLDILLLGLLSSHVPDTAMLHGLLSAAVQVTVFLIGAYAKYNWPYVWVSAAVGRPLGAVAADLMAAGRHGDSCCVSSQATYCCGAELRATKPDASSCGLHAAMFGP